MTPLLTITPGTHHRRRSRIWTAQLQCRVEPATFRLLDGAAKQHGGSYSTHGHQSTHGFVFFDECKAASFLAAVASITAPYAAGAAAGVADAASGCFGATVPPHAAGTPERGLWSGGYKAAFGAAAVAKHKRPESPVERERQLYGKWSDGEIQQAEGRMTR